MTNAETAQQNQPDESTGGHVNSDRLWKLADEASEALKGEERHPAWAALDDLYNQLVEAAREEQQREEAEPKWPEGFDGLIIQGSYNTSTAASAGTHAGGCWHPSWLTNRRTTMTDLTPEKRAELREQAESARPFVRHGGIDPAWTHVLAADLLALLDAADERDKLAAQVQRVREVAELYASEARHEPYGGDLWSTTAAALNAALNGKPA